MIKAIVFDMGGVILNLDLAAAHKAFRDDLGFADIEDYLNNYHQVGFFEAIENGSMSMEEFYPLCLSHCRPGVTPEMILGAFRCFVQSFNDGVVGLLKELSQQYALYLLSNNNPMSMSLLSSEFETAGLDLDAIFKEQFCSYRLRMMKPGREIFEYAQNRIGCAPGEILFIDDSASNIAGAEALGWKTLLYVPGTPIRDAVLTALNQDK